MDENITEHQPESYYYRMNHVVLKEKLKCLLHWLGILVLLFGASVFTIPFFYFYFKWSLLFSILVSLPTIICVMYGFGIIYFIIKICWCGSCNLCCKCIKNACCECVEKKKIITVYIENPEVVTVKV